MLVSEGKQAALKHDLSYFPFFTVEISHTEMQYNLSQCDVTRHATHEIRGLGLALSCPESESRFSYAMYRFPNMRIPHTGTP